MWNHKVRCVIPARYSSTRLPGKPLIDLGGKPMVVRSWERVRMDLPPDQIIVATDDNRIVDACHAHGIEQVELTATDCRTGTDRVAEVAARYPGPGVWVVAMGDNPLLPTGVIQPIVDALEMCEAHENVTATMGRALVPRADVQDETIQKMVIDSEGNQMFASRRPIPYAPRDVGVYWKQVNVYAFYASGLRTFASLPTGENEKRETLEMLRLIEHGHKVRTVEVEGDGGSVDVQADVDRVRHVFGDCREERDETLPDYLLD